MKVTNGLVCFLLLTLPVSIAGSDKKVGDYPMTFTVQQFTYIVGDDCYMDLESGNAVYRVKWRGPEMRYHSCGEHHSGESFSGRNVREGKRIRCDRQRDLPRQRSGRSEGAPLKSVLLNTKKFEPRYR